MSTVEEESDTVTVETVNSVTLTQDTEGNLILHCPQNGIELHYIVVFFNWLIWPPYIPAHILWTTQVQLTVQESFCFGLKNDKVLNYV